MALLLLDLQGLKKPPEQFGLTFDERGNIKGEMTIRLTRSQYLLLAIAEEVNHLLYGQYQKVGK